MLKFGYRILTVLIYYLIVVETKAKLGAKAIGRRILENIEGYELRETQNSYNHVLVPEKCSLS